MNAPGFAPGKKVLSAQEMDHVQDATAFLNESRKLLGRTQEDVAAAQAAGREEGFNAGYSEGRKAAFEDLAASIEDVRARLLAAETDLTDIVIAAVEKMIGEVDSVETARKALRRALQEAADAIWVTVRVASEDHAALKADLERIPAGPSTPPLRSIEADPLLKPGELVLETPKGRVHIGVRQQMARLQTGLARMNQQKQG